MEVTADVEIYAAVIERLVVRDHTFGRARSPFKHVFVIEGVVPDAGRVMGDAFGPPTKRFDPRKRRALRVLLKELPQISFVSTFEEASKGRDLVRGVKDDGVVISVGRIEKHGSTVHVDNGLWCGPKCGQWMTYVLERRDGAWRVKGTTGGMTIS